MLYLYILDNFISELRREDLQTLATSLKTLDLSGNSLTSVPEGIFWDLQRLESLDLSRNNIIQIHSMAFQNGVSTYTHVFNINYISLEYIQLGRQNFISIFYLGLGCNLY